MVTRLQLNHWDDWLLPGHPDDSRLFHADSSDRILVCPDHLGQGYIQKIQLRDDLILRIHDYQLHQSILLDGPGEPNWLEFEFGPGNADSAGFSEIFPNFGFKRFVMKQTHRIFKLEVIVQHSSLLAYFKAAQERLDPRLQEIPGKIAQVIYRYFGGTAKTSQKRLRQLLLGEISPPSDLYAGQALPIPLCLEARDLFYARRQPLTPKMEYIVGRVLSCPYQGGNRRGHLEDQVLELIALYLRALESRQRYENEFGYVYDAASILRQELANPPPIESLVRQVCTNRLKLNQGFHLVYGTTA
ncbi:MAG: AraC family transcriptional regulator [Cyanophyceae cyanobacterium]